MKVLLVCGSPEVAGADVLRGAAACCDAVVAVDRGLDAALSAGLTVDLFCGDADTVSAQGRQLVIRALNATSGSVPFDVERYDPYKDATDLALALSAVKRRWPGADICATCATGGKPDLNLTVLGQLLAYRAGSVSLVEDAFEARLLHGGMTWGIHGAAGRRFSIVALSDGCIVSEDGLHWSLDHAALPLLGDRGVSNYVDRSGHAAVVCHAGSAIAYLFNETSPLA